jgi:hypothetical protein
MADDQFTQLTPQPEPDTFTRLCTATTQGGGLTPWERRAALRVAYAQLTRNAPDHDDHSRED